MKISMHQEFLLHIFFALMKRSILLSSGIHNKLHSTRILSIATVLGELTHLDFCKCRTLY